MYFFQVFAVAVEGSILVAEETEASEWVEKLSAKLAKATKKHDDARTWVGQLESDLKATEGAKKWTEGSMANKETELASVKRSAEQESKKAREKLRATEEDVKKPRAELNQEKDLHRQATNSKKELEDKYQAGLAATRAKAIE